MPYCENCGSEITPTAKFCRNCGAAQTNSTAQPQASAPTTPFQPAQPIPPPPPTMQDMQTQAPAQTSNSVGEKVLGVMVLTKPKSLGRYDSFTGVVTNQRMILAQMTSDMVKQAVQMAKDQAKAEGKGFWSQWSDQMKASYGFAQRYFSIAPSAILTETPGNFAVDNNLISEVKIKSREEMRGTQVYRYYLEMEIHSTQGKYEFTMSERDDYIKLLKQVYGGRVKMPFAYVSHGINIG